MNSRSFLMMGAALLTVATAGAGAQTPYLHAPAVNSYARHDPYGTTILPTGRLLRPAGRSFPVSKWPHGLVMTRDGSTLFIASEGVGQIVTGWTSPQPTIRTVTLGGRHSNGGAAAFSPDGSTLYWSTGDSGGVYIVDVAKGEITGNISLNAAAAGRSFEDSFVMDLKLSADGRYAYCADVTNFRVGILDLQSRSLVGSIPVGRYPYAIDVVGSRVYVANIGMFSYSAIPPPTEPGFDKRGLTLPPFKFPSKESRDGVKMEGRFVPGLGDPNVPESFSVWGINVADPSHPSVFGKWKTGIQVGSRADAGPSVGGSGPDYVMVNGGHVWVSDGNNDFVEALDAGTGALVHRVPLRPSPLTKHLRGVMPTGLAMSPDHKRVYAAEMGINAIAVIDAQSGKVLGHIPTAWYPYRVAVSPDGSHLACICFRGFGNGPNAGKNIPKDPFTHLRGALTVLSVPTETQLAENTRTVLENNGMVDRSADRKEMGSPLIPTIPGQVSKQIKYVVFITKENHTYDTIFDHVKGANDDPTLLRWGYHQRISASGQPTLNDVAVMTNHNALAKQFTVSDNFYMEPEASGVGHRWLIGIQPNNFCQMTYTLGWEFKVNSTAPGRLASFGSNASMAPEDYPEAGAMWDNLVRHGVSFRNYGEGFEFAGVGEDEDESPTGAREVVNIPMPAVVYDNTCLTFPIFNMNIPDQYRAYWFQQDLTRLYLDKHKPAPSFLNIAICNDHGTGPNPAHGYPYVASWMADNDLALGRIVDFLSHTPYWKNMAIFVTQDDSGGEPDHVDAQRSVLLVISPWVKRGHVSHRLTTIVSMHRTLYEIFGLPPLNMFDGLANDFSDCFTTTPDFTPYNHTPVDPRIFDPEKAKDPKDPHYAMARKLRSIVRDDPGVVDRLEEEEKHEVGR
jgi:YVTN family beta-propeller protein